MYVAPVSFNFNPALIEQLGTLPKTSLAARNPIYRQINNYLAHGNTDAKKFHDGDHAEHVSMLTLTRMQARLDAYDPRWRRTIGQFREMPVAGRLKQAILNELPNGLGDLATDVAVQSRSGPGKRLPPHKDHSRNSTLWLLLSGQGDLTQWHTATSVFETWPYWQFADHKQLALAHEQVLELSQWYVFNNAEYHGVEPGTSTAPRVTLTIEFDLTAQELYDRINP